MKRHIAIILAALTVITTTQMGFAYGDEQLLISPNPTVQTEDDATVTEVKEPLQLNIEDAIKLAVENNQAYKDLDTSIEELRQARKGAKSAKDFANLGINGYTPTGIPSIDSQLAEIASEAEESVMGNYVEAIKQKNGYYVKQCDINIENLENAKVQMEAGLEIATRMDYYGVLTAEKAIELNNTNLNKALEQKKVADVKYKNGLATKIEVLSADIAVQKATTELNTAEDELDLAKLTLLNTMGLDYDTEIVLTEKTLEYVPTEDLNLDEAIAKALTDRAEIKRANNELILQEMDTHAITAYYTSNNKNYKIAEKKLESAKLNVAVVNKTVELDIRTKYLNLVKTERELLNMDKSIKLLEEALRVQQVLLENGMASPVDVINAQADLTSAQIGRFQMLTGYTLQKLSFEKSNILEN